MKLHLHRHHEHHGKRKAKKSHKLLKKMAKLERKLSKYSFDNKDESSDIDSSSSSDSSSRSRSHSRSRKRRGVRRHHRHHRGRRLASSCSSSSSSSSDSGSSDSSSDSSRSVSPHRAGPSRHHRHAHLSRSRSFAGRGCSPSAGGYLHRRHHHHRHPHSPHRRARFWKPHVRRCQEGIQGCLRMLAQSEPNLQERSEPKRQERNVEELVDLGSEPEETPSAPPPPAEMEQDAQEDDSAEQPAEQVESAAEGPAINDDLAKNWTEIAKNGLPLEARQSLLRKYPVSKNCLLLRGPRINEEILPVATEAGIRRDDAQMQLQKEIGAGLSALGQAITDLASNTELKGNTNVAIALEILNEAAVIVLDAHRGMTESRRAFMQPELKKAARSLVESCKPDEFLYGNDFGEKVKSVKGFRFKERRGWRGRNSTEERCEKGHKRKHEHDGDKRKSKRLDSFKKAHSGPKVH